MDLGAEGKRDGWARERCFIARRTSLKDGNLSRIDCLYFNSAVNQRTVLYAETCVFVFGIDDFPFT